MSLAALIIGGVPQGTVLGPNLILIFINKIYHCIKYYTIRCFADDTRISKAITCEGDVKALQDNLDAVVEWVAKNNMTLHEDINFNTYAILQQQKTTTCAIFHLSLISISTKHPWILYPQFNI